jgi:hypothetical protein
MHDEGYSTKEWLDKLEKTHAAVHNTERIARDKAEEVVNDRLANMNELRAQLDKQAGLFATRDELFSMVETMRTRIEVTEKFQSALTGHSRGLSTSWAIAISTISAVVILVNFAFFLAGK